MNPRFVAANCASLSDKLSLDGLPSLYQRDNKFSTCLADAVFFKRNVMMYVYSSVDLG